MTDDKRPPDQPDSIPGEGDGDASPSTIFVEMMRQAAARQAAHSTESPPDTPSQPETDDTGDLTAAFTEQPDDVDFAAATDAAPSDEADSDPALDSQPVIEADPPTFADDISFVEPDDDVFEAPGPPQAAADAPEPPDTPVDVAPIAPHPKKPRSRIPTYEAPPVVDHEADDTDDEARRAAALEAQRIRRVKRRRQQRIQRNVGIIGGFLRTMVLTLMAAGLSATIFTWFTAPESFPNEVVSGLQIASSTQIAATAAPTGLPTPNWLRRIGIVSGHRGPENDPGAVCPDGLTEAEINFNVAASVVRRLRSQGYTVDLLDEFDGRLDNYQAAALVSIHANSCIDYGPDAGTGYLVARAAARPEGGEDDLLANCLAQYYGGLTNLPRLFSLTQDMTDYHTFREIHPMTPAAIIEMGFMLNDRPLLTEQPELLAEAITRGVLCYLHPEREPQLPLPTLQPTPDF